MIGTQIKSHLLKALILTLWHLCMILINWYNIISKSNLPTLSSCINLIFTDQPSLVFLSRSVVDNAVLWHTSHWLKNISSRVKWFSLACVGTNYVAVEMISQSRYQVFQKRFIIHYSPHHNDTKNPSFC